MTRHADTSRCPNCDHPDDLDPTADGELTCPCCGWEFVVGPDDEVVDDGGLDPDGCFEVDDEGGLTTEPPAEVVCPKCGRGQEVADPGVARCPHCRAGFAVVWSDRRAALVAERPGRAADWLPTDDRWPADDDPEWEEPVCPDGCDDDCGGPAGVNPLGDGWVECVACGLGFHDAGLYGEAVEEQAARYDNPRAARRVVIGPGRRSLEEALGRIRPGGVIRLRPGRYEAPWDPYPFPVTLAAAGPRGSAEVGGTFRTAAGELRAVGVMFRDPVELAYTRADFDRCTFAGPLTASGPRSDVWVRGCRVRAGVVAAGGAAVRLIRSAVSGSPADGVLATTGGWVSLDRCRVRANGRDGVAAERPCGAFLRRCLVEGNTGVGVRAAGRAVLTGCRVVGNRGPDVRVGDGARAVLRRCELGSAGLARGRGARVRVRSAGRGDRPFVVG